MNIKIIHTEQQYHEYLDKIHMLMSNMVKLGTIESDRLELLTVLIESYENQKYPIEAPDPIDAILFRMHEKGLKQADLVQYFGTKSRVSEVLGRKRPLTVQMIRALSIGLGISSETLVGLASANNSESNEDVDWKRFPIKEMFERGWINQFTSGVKSGPENSIKNYIIGNGWEFGSECFKRTLSGDAYSPSTKYSLFAWVARVIQRARQNKMAVSKFEPDIFNADFLKQLVQLSWFDEGPLLAIEFLKKHGVILIIEPQLKGTMLDGAALKDIDGTPIVGLTLRHDRLDNYWFTLVHELAHLWKHVKSSETFLDNLDVISDEQREAEANRIAKEALIPRVAWKRSEAYLNPTKENIDLLSRELKIHPAIIAGRIRRETSDYSKFSDLVGYNEVRSILLNGTNECEVNTHDS